MVKLITSLLHISTIQSFTIELRSLLHITIFTIIESFTKCQIFFSVLVRCLSEDELLLLSPEELCRDRLSEEYFRLKADYDGGDCRDVVR